MAQKLEKNYKDHVKTIPANKRGWLDQPIDKDNGIDRDLTEIAKYVGAWETSLSVPLELTREDIDEINDCKYDLRKKTALQKWQNKRNLSVPNSATYGRLLRVFLEGGESRAAQQLCRIVGGIPGNCEGQANMPSAGTSAGGTTAGVGAMRIVADTGESREYTTILSCTEKLKLALSSSSSLLHSLYMNGLIKKDIYNELNEPRSMLSGQQKTNNLVMAIQGAVELNPKNFHKLLGVFGQNTREYGDIIDILNDEYKKNPSPVSSDQASSGGGPADENVGSEAGTGSVRKFEKFDTSMNYEELCLWLGSNQVPTEDQEIIRTKQIGGIAFKLLDEDKLKSFGISDVGILVIGHLKKDIK